MGAARGHGHGQAPGTHGLQHHHDYLLVWRQGPRRSFASEARRVPPAVKLARAEHHEDERRGAADAGGV